MQEQNTKETIIVILQFWKEMTNLKVNVSRFIWYLL